MPEINTVRRGYGVMHGKGEFEVAEIGNSAFGSSRCLRSRSCGSCRCFRSGSRCSRCGRAACAQSKYHYKSKCKSNDLFHFYSSI